MPALFQHKSFVVVIVILLVTVALFMVFRMMNQPQLEPFVAPLIVEEPLMKTIQEIGLSVEGRSIETYTYGNGDTDLLFVGGIHGGYEWNSTLLAYQFIDYFEENLNKIPDNITVHIIPTANPDGLYKIVNKEGRFSPEDVDGSGPTGSGRFNANNVDLNRNFACKWQPESTWRGNVVSAGTSAFSEPEAAALQKFVSTVDPTAVIFWHSQSNAVYASECEKGVLPETIQVMNTYADAAEYKAVESFDAYPISGDAEGWLASINIPAITVELSTHETLEWDKNFAGVSALFDLYSDI